MKQARIKAAQEAVKKEEQKRSKKKEKEESESEGEMESGFAYVIDKAL